MLSVSSESRSASRSGEVSISSYQKLYLISDQIMEDYRNTFNRYKKYVGRLSGAQPRLFINNKCRTLHASDNSEVCPSIIIPTNSLREKRKRFCSLMDTALCQMSAHSSRIRCRGQSLVRSCLGIWIVAVHWLHRLLIRYHNCRYAHGDVVGELSTVHNMRHCDGVPNVADR